MTTKICSKCKTEKDTAMFSKSSRRKDGLKCACKDCYSKQNKEWYLKNIENESERKQKQYTRDKEKITERNLIYRTTNYNKCLNNTRKWRAENKDKVNEYSRNYMKSILSGEKGELAMIRIRFRKKITSSITRDGYEKNSRTEKLLGCSFEELLTHVGVRPDTDYDIDHICPCAQAQNEEELIKLQHYSNLRWLKHSENLSKSDSWTPEGEEMCIKLLGRNWIHKETYIEVENE